MVAEDMNLKDREAVARWVWELARDEKMENKARRTRGRNRRRDGKD